jgi:hypothetical protein
MPEIHYLQVQIGRNRVAEGFYTIANGLLTMVYSDGEPVMLDDGSRVEHHLQPEDNVRKVAGHLTIKIRKALMGERVEGFSSPIDYPPAGVA